MKSATKALLWSGVIFVTVAALSWGGGILYWQIRINRAVRHWEKRAAITRGTFGMIEYGISREDSQLPYAAGCRALPALVQALETSRNPEFQEGLMERILQGLGGPGPWTDRAWDEMSDRGRRWQFIASGLDLEREQKRADFREWWQGNGQRYHRWWRFWSSWCGGD
ncbi:MAG: hypothetical protein HY293_22100 [Planctomycetes bacterium]|nr:hypothetical protein [Planctomycetota bacterium]